MSLVIEDGSIVEGAESYVSVQELVDYAERRGLTIPADNAERERLLLNAMDYIEAHTDAFAGERVHREQRLSWPRYGATLNGWPILENAIPDELKYAQLDVAANSVGIDLFPVRKPGEKGTVVEETVGPLSIKYAQPASTEVSAPRFPRADALLARLFAVRGLSVYRR